MADNEQAPVHVSIRLESGATHERSEVWVNGINLTRHVRGVRVEAGVGAVPDVWLDLIGVEVDIEADVPRSRIQGLTPEQDDVREHAKFQRDLVRGARTYGTKAGPSVLLAASLGEVKP